MMVRKLYCLHDLERKCIKVKTEEEWMYLDPLHNCVPCLLDQILKEIKKLRNKEVNLQKLILP